MEDTIIVSANEERGKKVKSILGRRYTTYQKLQHAQQQQDPTLDDLF